MYMFNFTIITFFIYCFPRYSTNGTHIHDPSTWKSARPHENNNNRNITSRQCRQCTIVDCKKCVISEVGIIRSWSQDKCVEKEWKRSRYYLPLVCLRGDRVRTCTPRECGHKLITTFAKPTQLHITIYQANYLYLISDFQNISSVDNILFMWTFY